MKHENKKMILRYTVETKHKSTFTASKKVDSKNDAEKIRNKLINVNKNEGYSKYSNFILYTNDNILICSINPTNK